MKSAETLKWINSIVGKNRKWIVFLTLTQICQGVSGVAFALFMRNVIDNAVSKRTESLFISIIALCLLVMFLIGLQTLLKYLDEKAKSTLEKDFRCAVFSQILHRSYAEISEVHSGEWMNKITSDTAVIINASISIIPGLAGTVFRLGGALVALIVLIPQLVLIVLPMGILLALFSLIFRNKLKSFHRDAQESDGKIRAFMQERINSLIVIKSFMQEEETELKALNLSDELVRARMRRIHFVNLCTTAMHLAMRGAYVLGAILCAYRIFDDAMSYGTMMAILQLINQVETPFSNISSFLPQYYSMIASAERLMEIEKIPLDSDSKIMSEEEIANYYHNDFFAVGLKEAYFSYIETGNGKTHILNNKSIEIKKGEYVAFVGESGCGKSTAMKLMMCLYPLNGGERYLIDNKGAKSELSMGWRKLFAYVPQGNFLVSGTIRQVLTFDNPELMAKEDEIQFALRIACADTFVNELPDGIDTLLGEQGTGLSEGQVQRLAIARAIMSGRPILLLDEATSSLDSETERKLLENLRTMTDKTVVLITHRPAALEICDKKIDF